MPSPTHPIQILDTTLRDGEQTQGVSFSPEEKLNIAKALLTTLKVDRIEIASARVSSGEQAAVRAIYDWANTEGLGQRIEVLGFIDDRKSARWIQEAGGHVINLLAKGSEKHCTQQLKKSLKQHLADIRRAVDHAHDSGLDINLYLEDWSNGYRDSPEYVYALIEALQDTPIRHFMLPDTLGVMTPTQVAASFADMCQRFPEARFDFHPHNDYGLATANALAAAEQGAASIHCTLNCLGERAGNASLPEVVVNLRDNLKRQLNVDESHLVRLSEMVEYFSGKRIAENAPIVGADVFTQTSGIHADGDKKGGLYISGLRPERFSRKTRYALGKMSGKASLTKNLEALDLSLSPENQAKVLERIVELGDSKKSITPEDLPFIIAEVLESKDYHLVELLNCSITSGLNLESTTSIRVRIKDEIILATGVGNGGFDAFMNAIKKPIEKRGTKLPRLMDYEIRIPKGGKSDALTECIITWDEGSGDAVKTRGLHANQVFASITAALRMINMQMKR